jgi:hypothetical protein
MIAGNIENSMNDTPDDTHLNGNNEWLQVVQGQLPPKKPAIKIEKPLYPVKKSTKQMRGLRYG